MELSERELRKHNVAGYSKQSGTAYLRSSLFYILETQNYGNCKIRRYTRREPVSPISDRISSELDEKTWGIISLGAIGNKGIGA